MDLRVLARQALLACHPADKLATLKPLMHARDHPVDIQQRLASPDFPGRPEQPVLVHPARVPKRRLGSPSGRAAFIHALAHIEFNAINLALDAAVRFPDQSAEYYRDWVAVACEEAAHFELLSAHLATLGHVYGDFPAHDGLWEAAFKTRGDVLARLGLVPRMLEARGLDVTPGLQTRLRAAGDLEAVAILDVLLRDEIGHVAIGNRWYNALCTARGLEPAAAFLQLCRIYGVKLPQPPFNVPARCAAGFDPIELTMLGALAQT